MHEIEKSIGTLTKRINTKGKEFYYGKINLNGIKTDRFGFLHIKINEMNKVGEFGQTHIVHINREKRKLPVIRDEILEIEKEFNF